MSTAKKLVGEVFGRLTVEFREGSTSYGKALWKCRCDCGNYVTVTTGSLISTNTTSCGCYLKERITKHGGWKKSSYNSWRAMIRRCNVSTDKDYPRYGAKGIKVCDQWSDYLQFAADMGEPEGSQTLDRIDPYGDYTPENCRWASLQTQARNVRVPKKSKTGITGVLFHGGRYYASITVKGKKYYSKVFSTIADAAQARKELELMHWSAS
jgi:hypothetical protein